MKDYRTKNALIIFWLFTILAAVTAVVLVWPFLPALLWATVFSILLFPMFSRLVERRWNRSLAAFAVTMIPALAVFIPVAVLGTLAGVQVVGYVQEIVATSSSNGEQSLLTLVGKEIDNVVQPILTQVGVTNVNVVSLIRNNESQLIQRIMGPVANGFQSLVVTIVTLVVSLLTTFFMVRDAHNMKAAVFDLIPLPKRQTEEILQRVANTVRSVFFAIVVVSGIQGAIAGLSYWIAGVPGAFVLTLITTLLSAVPMLGAPIVYVPVGASLLIQGKIWQGILVLAVGFVLVSNIDNFLRPFFIGASTKLHPIPVFFALVGGVLLMGPVGIMAGPMLLTVVLAVVDVLRLRDEMELPEESELATETVE